MQIPHSKRASEPLLIGFLTALEADGAVLGGYLVLNPAARPVEFHCTAPLRANRAQEILYGPTLRPYLYGEQVGHTLLTKSKLRPALVLTDSEPMLSVRGACEVLIACLVDVADTADAHHAQLGAAAVALPRGHADDRDALLEQWSRLDRDFDVREPFARIHEAINEAQKSRKAA